MCWYSVGSRAARQVRQPLDYGNLPLWSEKHIHGAIMTSWSLPSFTKDLCDTTGGHLCDHVAEVADSLGLRLLFWGEAFGEY